MPAIERDDGQLLAETMAIFEYLEEKQPTPPLIGATPEERADARMWQRRIELKITEHLYNGFRFAEGIELFRERLRVLPEAADGLKATVRDNLVWLDRLLEGRRSSPVTGSPSRTSSSSARSTSALGSVSRSIRS